MKVLYITTVPTPYKVDFFEELGKYCDLTVVFENKTVSYREDSWMINKFNNFKVFFLKGLNLKNRLISCDIIKYVRNSAYDCIIIGVYSTITQMIAQIYMKYNNIKYMISSDGGFIKKDSYFSGLTKRFFISSASAWLSTGSSTTEYLEYYGANKERIYVYPFTSIKETDILNEAISYDDKNELKRSLNIKNDKMILFVGQIIHRKGIDLLLKVTKKFPHILFCIIGGKPTKLYENMINELHITNVSFISFKNKNELAKYYKAADLFVLPTREDIWGLVINEAMAAGLPIITTDKCMAGLEMIQDGKTGSIVETENVQALSGAIEYWINKADINISNNVLKTAHRYTIEKMALRHFEILSDIKRYVMNGE